MKMPRTSLRILCSFIAAVCVVVALFCPWGFLCAFEPGQEAWLIIYPVAFVVSVTVGIVSSIVAARL
jgi:hypothetical protein